METSLGRLKNYSRNVHTDPDPSLLSVKMGKNKNRLTNGWVKLVDNAYGVRS